MTTPESTPDNLRACRCPGCPTYPRDGKKFYCGTGASAMKIKRMGCLCYECPIRSTYRFQAIYLCRGGKVP